MINLRGNKIALAFSCHFRGFFSYALRHTYFSGPQIERDEYIDLNRLSSDPVSWTSHDGAYCVWQSGPLLLRFGSDPALIGSARSGPDSHSRTRWVYGEDRRGYMGGGFLLYRIRSRSYEAKLNFREMHILVGKECEGIRCNPIKAVFDNAIKPVFDAFRRGVSTVTRLRYTETPCDLTKNRQGLQFVSGVLPLLQGQYKYCVDIWQQAYFVIERRLSKLIKTVHPRYLCII